MTVVEIIIAMFAAIGVACVFRECFKIFGQKSGRAEITVYFEDNADKVAFVEEIFADKRLEYTIKVPAESLSDLDRTELAEYIESGRIILI